MCKGKTNTCCFFLLFFLCTFPLLTIVVLVKSDVCADDGEGAEGVCYFDLMSISIYICNCLTFSNSTQKCVGSCLSSKRTFLFCFQCQLSRCLSGK